MLVPALTIVALVPLVAIGHPEHAGIAQSARSLSGWLGLGFGSLVIAGVASDVMQGRGAALAESLVLPFWLSASLIPWLIAAYVSVTYDGVFRRLHRAAPSRRVLLRSVAATLATPHRFLGFDGTHAPFSLFDAEAVVGTTTLGGAINVLRSQLDRERDRTLAYAHFKRALPIRRKRPGWQFVRMSNELTRRLAQGQLRNHDHGVDLVPLTPAATRDLFDDYRESLVHFVAKLNSALDHFSSGVTATKRSRSRPYVVAAREIAGIRHALHSHADELANRRVAPGYEEARTAHCDLTLRPIQQIDAFAHRLHNLSAELVAAQDATEVVDPPRLVVDLKLTVDRKLTVKIVRMLNYLEKRERQLKRAS